MLLVLVEITKRFLLGPQQVLTKMLVQKGYLDLEWARIHPTYYIEVKATTGSRDTRFFCSQEQVELMKDMHHKKGGSLAMPGSKKIASSGIFAGGFGNWFIAACESRASRIARRA